MLRAKCKKCKTEIAAKENTGKYVTCGCGAIGLDGGWYDTCRITGNIQDFDLAYDKAHDNLFQSMLDKAYEPGESFGGLVDKVWQWFDDKHLNDPVMQTVKVTEEVGELAHEIARHRYDSPEVIDALGDTLVTIIGVCHHLNISPAVALGEAYDEIKNRKGKVINGSFVKCEDNK